MFVFTDPKRSPNLFELAENLPEKSVLVYRHFSAPERLATAFRLKGICRKQKVKLLIGADPELAKIVGADGVHFPQSMIGKIPAIQAKHKFDLITCAAHSIPAGQQAIKNGAMAIVVSCVFPSTSISARSAMGICRFRAFVRKINAPVIALGGINETNVGKLSAACHGVAVVSGAYKAIIPKILN